MFQGLFVDRDLVDIKSMEDILKELEDKLGSEDSTLMTLRHHIKYKDLAYQRLEHDYSLFQSMVDLSPCTISWLKKDLTYIGANQALCEWTGLKVQDFIGNPLGEVIDDPELAEYFKSVFDLSHDEPQRTTLTREVNGVEKTFILTGQRVNNGEEAVIIGVDITDVTILENNMMFMERLSSIGEMMASILHEINNPLTVISSQSSMMEKKITKSAMDKESVEDFYKHTSRIKETCDRITQIIKGIKNFVHKDEHQEGQVKAVSINQVIEESLMMLNPRLRSSFVKIIYDKAEDFNVKGNGIQLSQIVVNLISNSIHAIEKTDKRWIKLELHDKSETELEIHIIDSGKGIDTRIIDKIFQSFYTTKKSGEGTGLGLSLSRKIIEGFGGSLDLKTDSPHTCFVITLRKAPTQSLSHVS